MTFATTKQGYETINNNEGVWVLADRLWPRFVSKQALKALTWYRKVDTKLTLMGSLVVACFSLARFSKQH